MIARRIRFLVLRGGAIGDFVVPLPALAAIRERWPEAYIECIGYPNIAQLAQIGGLVGHVGSLDKAGIARFFASLPCFTSAQVDFIRSFDLVFSYLHDRNGMVRENLELAGAKQVIYGSPLIPADVHAVDHLVKPLESVAIYAQGAEPRLPWPDSADPPVTADTAVSRDRDAYWVLHTGSGSPRKNWPTTHFLQVAERLEAAGRGTPLFLLGEADDMARQALQGYDRSRVLSGLALPEVAAWLRHARGYIGNDSGITHLAAALGTPTCALFGPTDPAQWGPRGSHVRILQAPDGNWEALTPDTVYSTC